MSNSNPFIQDLLDLYFFNEAPADEGWAAAHGTAGTHYINLYSTLPSAGGAGVIVSYTGYTEITKARTTAGTHWSRTAQRISNVATFDFGKRTNSGAAVVSVGWGISMATGDTTPAWFAPHWSGDPFMATTDDGNTLNGTPNTTNALVAAAHGLVNDDLVMVMAAPGGSLPTNLSQGVAYYVVNKTTDTFQLSLTLGGAAINISSGEVWASKAVTLSIAENITPKIAAGELQIYG